MREVPDGHNSAVRTPKCRSAYVHWCPQPSSPAPRVASARRSPSDSPATATISRSTTTPPRTWPRRRPRRSATPGEQPSSSVRTSPTLTRQTTGRDRGGRTRQDGPPHEQRRHRPVFITIDIIPIIFDIRLFIQNARRTRLRFRERIPIRRLRRYTC